MTLSSDPWAPEGRAPGGKPTLPGFAAISLFQFYSIFILFNSSVKHPQHGNIAFPFITPPPLHRRPWPHRAAGPAAEAAVGPDPPRRGPRGWRRMRGIRGQAGVHSQSDLPTEGPTSHTHHTDRGMTPSRVTVWTFVVQRSPGWLISLGHFFLSQ